MKIKLMSLFIMGVLAMSVNAADKLSDPAGQTGAAAQPGKAAEKTAAASQPAEPGAPLANEKEKLSYSIGQNIGMGFKQQEIDINLDALVKGMQDALAGRKPLLTRQEMEQVLMAYQKEHAAKMAIKNNAAGGTNLKEGEAFLAANKKKEGVITLPSGLQYKVIKSGSGKTPKLTDKVTTHYRGTLIDGTVFDSSYDRGEPATFPVSGVIAGWTEALQLMKEGDKWQLVVPAQLGYGERGAGGKIGPNTTLLFDIELLKVEP